MYAAIGLITKRPVGWSIWLWLYFSFRWSFVFWWLYRFPFQFSVAEKKELKKCFTAHSSLICPPPESGSISGICYANGDFYTFNSSINCKVKRWNDNVRTYKRTTFKLSSLQQTSILQFTLNFLSQTKSISGSLAFLQKFFCSLFSNKVTGMSVIGMILTREIFGSAESFTLLISNGKKLLAKNFSSAKTEQTPAFSISHLKTIII